MTTPTPHAADIPTNRPSDRTPDGPRRPQRPQHPSPRGRTPGRRAAAAAGVAVTAIALTACGGDAGSGERSTATTLVDGKPLVVVTYSVLGDVVSQLVGDAATVQVVIPDGQDPHEYAPSARDVERMRGAALVVANGLDLEEGLEDALQDVRDDAIPVFFATDHITLRELGEDEGAHEGDEHADDEHGHGSEDPHLWTDPLTMREVAGALAATLEAELGVQLDARLATVQAEMDALDAQVREILSVVPAGGCKLVTGHESLGYFADRYGCELIGAVIPSLSSTAEATARDIAELTEVASAAGVAAIFTEVGTPSQVAEQVASEVGVDLVELPSHDLPDTGGYQAFVVDLAGKIATGLTGDA